MKAIAKQWKANEPADTPYARARQEWDNRMGSAVVQAKNWRYATFATLLFVAFPSLIGMIYLGSLPKLEPHVIEVNTTTGESSYRGVVGETWQNFTPTNSSIQYHLRRFLEDTRTVSGDAEVIRKNWFDAYKLVTPNAANTLSTYAQNNIPFERAKKERVYIKEIISQQPISPDTWQVEWSEEIKNKRGQALDVQYWKAIFTIKMQKPETVQELAGNPIGLYIDDFNWSEINRAQ